jgi:hypothetical protein
VRTNQELNPIFFATVTISVDHCSMNLRPADYLMQTLSGTKFETPALNDDVKSIFTTDVIKELSDG